MIKASTVNRELRKIDPDAQLINGGGYWYFGYGIAEMFISQPVTSKPINSFTLRQWVDMFKDKIDELREYDDYETRIMPHRDYVCMIRSEIKVGIEGLRSALRVGK